MGLTVREPLAVDFLAATDVNGKPAVRRKRLFSLLHRQLVDSEAMTIVDDAGQVVAIAGLYENTDGVFEIWLTTTAETGRHLVGALRIMRRALAQVGALVPGLEVTAYIDPRSVAGDRLARLLGFTEAGITEHEIGPLRTWRRNL